MKKSFIVSFVMAGLALVTANSAFATASVSNAVSVNISADTAGTGGSGAYTTLTGPGIAEGSNRDITNGTIILTVSTNFQFNPAASVSVAVTRLSGFSNLVGLASSTAIVTTSNITITVTNQDGLPNTTSLLMWSGIQVRPLLGTPLATNTITIASNSTANVLGFTKGVTSLGQLREILGAANKLGYTTAPASTNTAGVALTNVVVQVQDRFGNTWSTNNVAVGLTLNTGAFASGNTNANTGAAGSATFSNLVMNTAGDFTLTASAPATTLSNSPAAAFTVVPAAPSTLQITQDAPASIFAGVTFPSNVTVLVTDSFGNPISNKTVTLSLLSGAPLGGTTSQPSAGNGVATFSGLSVAQAGSQALVASISSPSLSVTGTTFTVNAGFASQLGYTIAPAATTTAGVTMVSIVVQIEDQAGNAIASNGVPITVALNAGGFTSGTTTVNTGPDGSATFNDLVINTSGNYTLTASATGTSFTSTPAAPFSIAPGAPSVFQITQDAPSSTTAGTVFSPAVTVLLTDSLNNPITNTTVTLTLLGGGTLNGTVSQPTAVNGVATFANLNITVPGASYALVANSVNSLSVTGNTFVVTAAPASKLVYTSVPTTTNTAGSTLSSFTIQITDPFGNAIPTNGVQITMSLANGTFASGTTITNSDVNGSASIGDLVITNAGNNIVTASASGLASANDAVVILPATFAMTFQQDAPSPATAGVTFSPPVAVRIADPYNNPLTNKTVTLTLLGGGSLTGTLSQATSASGVASFNNLAINLAGTNYSLVATISSPSLTVTGATFAVNTAPPSKLVFTSVPPAITNIAGSTLSSFGIQVQDPFNNNVLTNGVVITMTLSNGTFASGTTTTNSDVNGSANIGDLVITNAGNNTVTASATGLTSAGKALVILPAPYAITFQQDAPALTNAGAVFAPPVAVRIADQYNNVLSNRIVTLTLLNGGGPLVGPTSQTTTNTGVATFTNLTINVAGTNYALVATTNALGTLSVTGQTFTVTAAAPTKLAYTGTPATTNIAGATLSSFVVQVQDQFNNSVPTNGVPISMTLSNGTFASGTTSTNTDPTGSVTIGDLVITNAGNNRVIASSAGLTSTNKIMVITPATLSLALLQDAPAVTNAGAVFTPPVTVKLADQYNNIVSNRTVTMSLLNGSLSGTTSVSTSTNGVATFSTLNVTTPGTNYALVASSTNSLSVTGATFTVTVGAPSKLAYTLLPPASNVAGTVIPTFVLQVEDSLSNPISTNNVPITMSLNTGTFSSGTTNMTTQPDGSSAFGDLAINNAGTYTMTATSPGLTPLARLITITPDTASNLAFIQQPPAVTNAGTPFTPAVTVKVTDQFNNAISNMTVIVSLNGPGTLAGTLSHTTATNGIASFNNLSVNLPGTGDFLTAITTNPALSVNSSTFNINVGPIDHYLVTTNSSPQMRGTPFAVSVTAQDVASNTVPDNSTVVTMSGSTANVQFDANGDATYGDNTQTLSNGTFTINVLDIFPENITVTAKDANNKTGSIALTVNAVGGDYRSATNGTWSATTTWQTWNGSSWVAASTAPAGGAGTNITIQSTHTVTNNVAVSLTGMLITQGSLTFSGGSISVNSGGVVLNSGVITNSSLSTLIFNSGGTYEHNYTTTAGNIPTAAWNVGSTFEIVGYTTATSESGASGWNQSFYNFTFNCPNQNGTFFSLASVVTTVNGNFTVASGNLFWINSGAVSTPLTVGGDFDVQGGTLVWGNTPTGTMRVNIGGNYNQTGGTFSNGSDDVVLNFTGANKTFTQSSGILKTTNMNFSVTNSASLLLNNTLTISSGQNLTVFNTGTLNCGTNVVSGTGSFVLNSGGALGIGSTDGVASAGSVGNIQTTSRTFSPGGVYIYNGSASQATGSGLPGTVSSLIVSNTGGIVTLGSSPVVTSNLTVSAGVFDLGGFTANRASNGGTVTVASGAALKIGGTNTFPTNYVNRAIAGGTVEYEGSDQSVPALTYGTLNTSGSGTKTLLAGSTSIAGDLNIGVGTTFNAVTNSFTIAGNLTNNGTAFAFTGPQTVTFTGSGTQNVSGASATAFNTFAIGSNTVINLDDNDTALEFTIAGLDQAGGTWGSTASGATNPDDTNFLGLGTLDVTPPTFGMSFLQDAPAVASAGVVFSPAVTVQLTSSATNLIVNKTVTLTLNGGGALGGTPSVLTDTNGVATFTNLFINAAGTNYSLTASITNPSLSVTGNTFVVTAAAATKLVYTTVPATVTNVAGTTLSNFVVQVEDQFNNGVPTNGVPITMSLTSGTFGAGTTTLFTGPDGSALSADLVITNAGNNTVTATASGLTSASKAFVILPAPYAITFLQDAPAVTNAGAVFSPPVTVRIADAFNNVLSNRTVTLTLLSGGTLGGTTSRSTTNNGVATFTNLFINAAGTNYALVATSTNSLSVTGNTFVVTSAAASKLAYTTLPPTSTVAGVTLPTFVLQVQDQFNNSIATNGVSITMSLSNGTAFASGTTNMTTQPDGSAAFGDLVITNAGNRILVASAPGLTSTNRAITVTPDVANSTISFVQGPAPTISAGTVFTNTVQIIDEFNNGVSNATITLSPNGFATLSGTVSRATAGNGLAIFNNLSVATPGSNYFITATSGSLSTNSSLFNVTVGAINHYLVTASSPQVRGTGFPVTVTALDAANNVVPDNSTVVNMSGSTVTVLFDGTGDNSYTNSSQVLSNGTFTINAQDTVAETITITASDATGKTGTSPAIVINAASGDYRTFQTGPWNTAATWQIWDGTNWDAATTPPAGGAGTNITILSTHRVTNNVAVALSGTLITQGSLTFNGGSIAVGSGGLVQNAGVITNSSASTLLFNAGATYQHAVNGPNIPNAAYNSNSLLRVTGITSTIVTLPTSISGSVEWNCPNQTAVAAIILSAATTIGGDFNVVSTGTGSIIDGGTTARNLTVGGNMNVRGGTYYAIGGNGSSAGNVTVSVANDLTVSGGNFSMVVGQGGTSSFNVSGTLIVGGDLTLAGGTLAILTNTTYASSGVSSMTVSGNTSIAGGLLNLTVATSGNAAGVTATLMGNLAISGGTINRGGTLPAIVNFASTSTVTYTKSGGVITGAVNFAILQGATVNFGTSLLDGSSGTFTLNAGGRIGLGDPNGITTSGQTGNIRVTGTRTYSTGARYVYNGSVPQDTGNGLPATVTSLTISNTAATVTLDASVNVTSNLTVSSGAFDMGAFTADRITSGGTITVANGSALKIGGTNTFPANYANLNLGTNSTVEYEGSGQSVASISYGNLNTSGTGTKTLLPGLAAITNLTIGAGTTLDAGTNSFSIAGNWSNNGSFTATNAQTVTFDGASPQTVDGSVATTFNNVEIDTGSVLDLAIDGSTAQFLSIGGVNQPTGTWGSSASAATHVDDVDFQGTGTLNVGSALTSPSTTTVVTSGSPSIYGQPVTFTASVAVLGGTPPATGTVTFMAGASTLGSQALSGSPTGTAAFVTGTLLPGTYTITAVYNGDANFLASSNSVAQEVDVAPLIITANSTAKTYGQTLSFGGTEFMTSGLTNGDTVTSVTLTSGGTLANASAGNYSIIPSAAIGTGLANYTITYSNGTLMVNQASVTGSITASNKVYDGTTVATIASYGLAGVFSNDTVTLGGGTANFIDKNVGTNKSVTATGLVLSGGDAGNYLLTSSNANTTADITAAALSISADNKTKTAGLPNPTLTATYVGFVGGDDTNSLSTQVTLSTTATDSSPAGTYTITASGAVAANYTITYNNGTLTVVGVPQITNTKVVGGQFIFSFPTVSNENYQVEFKTDLHAPTWTNSGGLIAGTGNTITVTNAITSSAVFYRVEVSPGN